METAPGDQGMVVVVNSRHRAQVAMAAAVMTEAFQGMAVVWAVMAMAALRVAAWMAVWTAVVVVWMGAAARSHQLVRVVEEEAALAVVGMALVETERVEAVATARG